VRLENGGMMKETYIFLMILLFFPAFANCAEEKSIWKDGKLYEGQAYDKLEAEEKEQVKKVAEEFAMALLMKDEEDIEHISYYDGFPSEKKEKIFSRLGAYHNQEGFACTNIEVITVKLKNDMKEATVGVKVHFSTIDTKGGLSTAPSVYKRGNLSIGMENGIIFLKNKKNGTPLGLVTLYPALIGNCAGIALPAE
jgi:hypothetical protein